MVTRIRIRRHPAPLRMPRPRTPLKGMSEGARRRLHVKGGKVIGVDTSILKGLLKKVRLKTPKIGG
jgi:hypothetical protein